MKTRIMAAPDVVPVRADARLPSLDAARFVASLGVVWIHASSFARIGIADDPGFAGRFALPFFTFTSVLFACGAPRRSKHGIQNYALSRLCRLYVPFLLWTAVYLCFKQLRCIMTDEVGAVELSLSVLWDGGSYHLWFLPFLYIVTVGAFTLGTLHRFVSDSKSGESVRWTIISAAWIAGAIVAVVPNPFEMCRPLLLRFGWPVMPAALWAVGAAFLPPLNPPRKPWRCCAAGLALLALGVAALCTSGPHTLFANLAGVGCAIAGLSGVRGKAVDALQRLGTIAFSVYLVHIMPMGLLRGHASQLQLDPAGLGFAVVLMCVASIVSVGGIWGMGQLVVRVKLVAALIRLEEGEKTVEAARVATQTDPAPQVASRGAPTVLLARLRHALVG